MKGKRYEIYVGLKDKDTYEEIFNEKDFTEILSKICSKKELGFSLVNQIGGYSHGKGYTTETSLKVSLINIDKNTVKEIADYLKKVINTDTVLITSEHISFSFV